jgi:hypothetical protein
MRTVKLLLDHGPTGYPRIILTSGVYIELLDTVVERAFVISLPSSTRTYTIAELPYHISTCLELLFLPPLEDNK